MGAKNFILDTNVILHDSHCIYNFEDNNIIIPTVVLEEIDKFKKGDTLKNFHARTFTRTVDELYTDIDFHKGASLGEGRGILRIAATGHYSEEVKSIFMEDIVDHRILGLAYNLTFKENMDDVVIVTKDINLRMKAKAIGLKAEDYTTGTVKNVDELYKGGNVIEDISSEIIDDFYHKEDFQLSLDDFPVSRENIVPNQFFILKGNNSSVLVKYNPFIDKIVKVEKRHVYGIRPRNSEQIFAMDALLDTEIPVVALSGKAGTGKTLLALASALENRDHYNQIFLARPVTPLSNKDIGYLPGDIKSKLNPYMQPLWDNLGVIKNQFSDTDMKVVDINKMTESKQLVIEPLAYIRGRTLDKIFFIVDEAQNLTPHEIKTIITRVGAKSKIVFTGDPYQIDTPYLDAKSNGLSYLISKFSGQKLFAHVTLEKGERSELSELASNLL